MCVTGAGLSRSERFGNRLGKDAFFRGSACLHHCEIMGKLESEKLEAGSARQIHTDGKAQLQLGECGEGKLENPGKLLSCHIKHTYYYSTLCRL